MDHHGPNLRGPAETAASNNASLSAKLDRMMEALTSLNAKVGELEILAKTLPTSQTATASAQCSREDAAEKKEMLLAVKQKMGDSSWPAIVTCSVAAIVISSLIGPLLDLVIAIILAMPFQMRDTFTQWDPTRFYEQQEVPEFSSVLVIPIWLAMTFYIFVLLYVYILESAKSSFSHAML